MKATTNQNQAYCQAHNMIYGDVLDNVKQLQKITFEKEDIEDSLIRLCEYYHFKRKEQESFEEVGQLQFNELETSFYKWTNPLFWVASILEWIYIAGKSLFVNAKDFKHDKK